MKQTKIAALVAGCSLLFASTTVNATNNELANAVASDFRQQGNTVRDVYRHPTETLSFFDIKPDQTVVELWPGGGWYAEILAPYLNEKGQYIAAGFNTKPTDDTPMSQFFKQLGEKFQAWVDNNPTEVGNAKVVVLDPPAQLKLAEDNSVDAVLTFRNLHNWSSSEQLSNVFTAAYSALKLGGVFGVVEHRGNANTSVSSGYMKQDNIIALAEKVGFKFVASSEINANPADTKDYPKGVWTLPPTLKLGDKDKNIYTAIGESDRMTLKFVKQ